MKQKRLFVVRRADGKVLSGAYSKKKDAKKVRDMLGGTEGGFTVGIGPDHWRAQK